MEIRNYSKVEDVIEIQNLVQIQTKAYRDFCKLMYLLPKGRIMV